MMLANVSRETAGRLEVYRALLEKWNRRINLVSRASLVEHPTRHFEDSAQLYDLVTHPVDHWADLGSGGGFPGLIIAILGQERGSPARVTLVESDARKSAFLNTVIRETAVNATVVTARIETIPPLDADVLSARALADLSTLLGFAARHMRPDGQAVFPKGRTWQEELAVAQTAWKFSHRVVKSKTETGPVILHVRGISRV
ncbi:MAG: 16S rRNA (guanine(527)-N(7))-methyltransferase RsmG [Alphaproteobacteria bacterium HGW-Alphaproteobacteria-1]|jgi:16S rRNA (guanine527-N7)-methyltransferase|nr:MAG: 16S rRNA (guanine(527)-N(7))-methyltransferase RsmG [Alphaproteobacteria bacterium HGW-Alphaproteobacteria-1]